MSKSPYVDPHKSGHEIWEEFSMSFTPAVKEVVEFAKRIPGFRDLCPVPGSSFSLWAQRPKLHRL